MQRGEREPVVVMAVMRRLPRRPIQRLGLVLAGHSLRGFLALTAGMGTFFSCSLTAIVEAGVDVIVTGLARARA